MGENEQTEKHKNESVINTQKEKLEQNNIKQGLTGVN